MIGENENESIALERTFDDLGCHRSPVNSVTMNSAIYLLVLYRQPQDWNG